MSYTNIEINGNKELLELSGKGFCELVEKYMGAEMSNIMLDYLVESENDEARQREYLKYEKEGYEESLSEAQGALSDIVDMLEDVKNLISEKRINKEKVLKLLEETSKIALENY